VFLINFTSGTTGTPRGVRLTHGNMLATLEAAQGVYPAWEHRIVSLLPLSHGFGQVELLYVLTMSGQILYVRSRTPRVLFDAIREHRMTTMNLVPQVLDLFWASIVREVEARGKLVAFERTRRIARRLPFRARRLIFRKLHQRLGGGVRLFSSGAAFLPPALQQAWEDLGVVVIQAYGTTECGLVASTSWNDHPVGRVGRAKGRVAVEIAEDGELLVTGPTVSPGYWVEAGEPLADHRGRYHTGDIARRDADGNLTLLGRKKNIIVLPNGLNVYPEDVESALRDSGLRDTVVLETQAGRIAAVVVDPDGPAAAPGAPPVAVERTAAEEAAIRQRIEARVRAANASLTVHERVDSWQLWPDSDFPRTHTLKIRRDPVRQWATRSSSLPLPVRDEPEAVGVDA
jgi:long-chain acyl-CoA synthetase